MRDRNSAVDEGTDGRRAWRERNRDAVVDALLDLYEAGVVAPSADEVAECSGVSRRSVFRYFDDMDDLCHVAIARHRDRVIHLTLLEPLGKGTLEERLDRLCDQRFRLYPAIAPVARVARIRAPLQPILKEQLRSDGAQLRRQVELQLAPELDAMAPEARRRTLAAADALTSFETFDFLTDRSGLPLDDALAVVRSALATLFVPV